MKLVEKNLLKFAYDIFVNIKGGNTPVFLCVGSDKWVCDSFGPIVAEKLRHEYKIQAYVYGGLDYNVNASNLSQVINYIETVHVGAKIVLIDATLGDNVGEVEVKESCVPGLGKTLPLKRVGDISILGVVGRSGRDFNLNSTRLQLVLRLSDFVSLGCFLALNKFSQTKNDNKKQYLTNIHE